MLIETEVHSGAVIVFDSLLLGQSALLHYMELYLKNIIIIIQRLNVGVFMVGVVFGKLTNEQQRASPAVSRRS